MLVDALCLVIHVYFKLCTYLKAGTFCINTVGTTDLASVGKHCIHSDVSMYITYRRMSVIDNDTMHTHTINMLLSYSNLVQKCNELIMPLNDFCIYSYSVKQSMTCKFCDTHICITIWTSNVDKRSDSKVLFGSFNWSWM